AAACLLGAGCWRDSIAFWTTLFGAASAAAAWPNCLAAVVGILCDPAGVWDKTAFGGTGFILAAGWPATDLAAATGLPCTFATGLTAPGLPTAGLAWADGFFSGTLLA